MSASFATSTSGTNASPRNEEARQSIFDRWFWIAILVTAAIVIPRSLSIAHAHSESWDDQYHLSRGLAQWRGDHLKVEYNDPPFGEMILATPLWITGCSLEATAKNPFVMAHRAGPVEAILYGQPVKPQTLLMLVAGWKAILFIAAAAVIFLWCRRLYGLAAACIALAAVLADPTIAAHIAVAALDTLALTAVLIGCYLTWRSLESPHPARLVGACAAVAAAVSIKLAAVFVLPACLFYVLLHWKSRAWRRPLAIALLLVPLFIWAFTLFDISRPNERAPVMSADYTEHWSFAADVVNANLARRWPAGIFVSSVATAFAHASGGHPAYLLGEVRRGGWWYYPFVAAAVKVPVGIAVFILLGFGSLIFKRIRFAELSLLIPGLLALLSVIFSNVSIGFRHSIPWYVFAMMFASRCVAAPTRTWSLVIAWMAILATAINGLWWHPDELSFVNLPWKHPASIVSDVNIDWGQSLKQIRDWLDAHPHPGEPVYAQLFIPDSHGVGFDYYLDSKVQWIGDDVPRHGLLIVSPVMIWGGYAPEERFEFLRERKPIAIIGHCIRVYDLDSQ